MLSLVGLDVGVPTSGVREGGSGRSGGERLEDGYISLGGGESE